MTHQAIGNMLGRTATAVSIRVHALKVRGVQVQGPLTNSKGRQTMSKPPVDVSRAAMRGCLRCGNEFHSWGPGNRMCPGCLDFNEDDYGGLDTLRCHAALG